MATFIDITGHGFVEDQPIFFLGIQPQFTGIVEGQLYYVIADGLTADTFQFSETVGGLAFEFDAITEGTVNTPEDWIPVEEADPTTPMKKPVPPDAPEAPVVSSEDREGWTVLRIESPSPAPETWSADFGGIQTVDGVQGSYAYSLPLNMVYNRRYHARLDYETLTGTPNATVEIKDATAHTNFNWSYGTGAGMVVQGGASLAVGTSLPTTRRASSSHANAYADPPDGEYGLPGPDYGSKGAGEMVFALIGEGAPNPANTFRVTITVTVYDEEGRALADSGTTRSQEVHITSEYDGSDPVWTKPYVSLMTPSNAGLTVHAIGGVTYAVRARFYDMFGNYSPWSEVTEHTVLAGFDAVLVPTTDAPSGANITIDAAATPGAGTDIARATHGHRLNTSSSSPAAIGTAAAGTSGHSPSRDDHVHAASGDTPSTQAFGDSPSVGTSPKAAQSDHKHGMPASPTQRAASSTTPAPVATTGAVGTGVTDARDDHVHAHEPGHIVHDTIWGAAGDLAVGTGADTAARLAAGADDTVLTIDPVTHLPSWNAPAGGAPSGPAGGDLSGTYPDPDVVDDSHAHTSATVTTHSTAHAHADLTSVGATDHHAAPVAGPDADVTVDTAGAAGTAGSFARSGHGHKLATASATPAAVGTSGAAGTSGNAPSRSDHVHAHETAHVAHDTLWDTAGDLVVGTGADTAGKLALTVPAANILSVLGVVNGETTPTWKEAHDATNPAAIGTAAPGTSTKVSHRDHVHATGAGTPSTQAIGDAAATGTGPAAAMTDHKHAMPSAQSVENGNQGTSFPGSPSSNDRYFRTDLGMAFYYDGTRWLSQQIFCMPIYTDGSLDQAYTATGTALRGGSPALLGGSDIYILKTKCDFIVNSGGTALGASHKWVITIQKTQDAGTTNTTFATTNIDSGSSGVWRSNEQTVNALQNSGTVHDRYIATHTKTGTPGSLQMHVAIYYRIVAT